jgi:hypothetical protein
MTTCTSTMPSSTSSLHERRAWPSSSTAAATTSPQGVHEPPEQGGGGLGEVERRRGDSGLGGVVRDILTGLGFHLLPAREKVGDERRRKQAAIPVSHCRPRTQLGPIVID